MDLDEFCVYQLLDADFCDKHGIDIGTHFSDMVSAAVYVVVKVHHPGGVLDVWVPIDLKNKDKLNYLLRAIDGKTEEAEEVRDPELAALIGAFFVVAGIRTLADANERLDLLDQAIPDEWAAHGLLDVRGMPGKLHVETPCMTLGVFHVTTLDDPAMGLPADIIKKE